MFTKIFKIIVNTVLFLLIILGIFVVFSFVPFPGNYKVFTVQSGSMEPAIKTGSLIFVRPEGDYNISDVVTRRTNDPKVTITHRIVSKEELDSPQSGEAGGKIVFETKGDANNTPDGEKFTSDGIIGKEVFKLPYVGYPVSYAKTTQGLILLIIIPAVIIIYDEANKIKAEIALMLAKKKKRNEEDIKIDN